MLLAVSGVAPSAPAAGEAPWEEPVPELEFDQAAFERILGRPARHRQCFGITSLAGGGPLALINAALDAYKNALHEPQGYLHPVAVLYHGFGVAFAFNDALWNEYVIPTLVSLKQAGTLTPGDGNPYLRSGNDSNPASVESLASRGTTFVICHNAFKAGAYQFAALTKRSSVAVYKQMRAGVVAGAIFAPAGVMAINACQEAKFTYLQT